MKYKNTPVYAMINEEKSDRQTDIQTHRHVLPTAFNLILCPFINKLRVIGYVTSRINCKLVSFLLV